MDQQVLAVGNRIRERMSDDLSQRKLAVAVDMTPDALSRAMAGKRGFSLSEITKIAGVIDTDLTWLLTGKVSEHRVEIAARHAWDPVQRERANPRQADDLPMLDNIADLYRSAFPTSVPASGPLPSDPAEVRFHLGEDFPLHFAEQIELVFDIDVIRVSQLSTDYSLRIGNRGIIVLNAIPNWFRSNWSLAHELAHLALGHHDGNPRSRHLHENAADKFASDLLLPAQLMRSYDWQSMRVDELGRHLWKWGVSTRALAVRLAFLKVAVSDEIAESLNQSTPRLLNGLHEQLVQVLPNPRAVAERQQRSSARRFPLAFVEALTRRTETGEADPRRLAFVLDLSIDDTIDSYSIPDEESDAEMAARLIQRPFKFLGEVERRA